MKIRWISVGVGIGFALALTVGAAFASDPSTGPASRDTTHRWAGMETMHDSAAMRRMHEQMPEELQGQCDALHEQMSQMMPGGGMMDGDMGSHHPETPGGMMGSGSPGDMMGSGSGGMMGS